MDESISAEKMPNASRRRWLRFARIMAWSYYLYFLAIRFMFGFAGWLVLTFMFFGGFFVTGLLILCVLTIRALPEHMPLPTTMRVCLAITWLLLLLAPLITGEFGENNSAPSIIETELGIKLSEWYVELALPLLVLGFVIVALVAGVVAIFRARKR